MRKHLALLALAASLCGCGARQGSFLAAAQQATPAPPKVRLSMPLPEALSEDATVGFSRSVTVVISNEGEVPVLVTELRVSGLAEAGRKLYVPAPGRPGFVRAFGFLPPGDAVRYRLGVGYPRPGSGTLRLHARLRLLPSGTPGKVMEEVVVPAAAPADDLRELLATATLSVAPRAFDRQVATARALASAGAGARVKTAAYSQTLGGWMLFMEGSSPLQTLLATPGETRAMDGLSLAAVRLMDHYEAAVPVLDGEGRLREIPRGPLLRILIEESLRAGHSIGVTEYAPGKEALHVE